MCVIDQLPDDFVEAIGHIADVQSFEAALRLLDMKISRWETGTDVDPAEPEVLCLPLDPRLKQRIVQVTTDDELADCFKWVRLFQDQFTGEDKSPEKVPF